jgi:hypothetical protein
MDDLRLRIGADISGVQAGGDQLKSTLSAIQTAVDRVSASFKAIAAAASDGLASVSSGAGVAKAAIAGAVESMGGLADLGGAIPTAPIGELVTANNAANGQIVNGARDAAGLVHQIWTQTIRTVVDGFATGVEQMIEKGASFVSVMENIGKRLLNNWISMIGKQVEATIMGEMGKVAAKKAGAAQGAAIDAAANLKTIVSDAATAASGAYKAMAGIPVIGPFLGAAAAATVFAAVMAFRGLVASAAGGFDIPAGVNPLTQLHAQEMVLPAHLANPMRAMLSNYQAGDGAGFWGASGGHSFTFGDTHVQGSANMGRTELELALSRHRDVLMDQIHSAVRGGWTSTAPSPFRA